MRGHAAGGEERLARWLGPLRRAYFVALRRPAWALGYADHKMALVRSALADPDVMRIFRDGAALPPSFGRGIDERIVEYPWAVSRLAELRPRRVLDAGSTLNYAEVLDAEPLQGPELHIVTLAPEPRCYWWRGFSYVFADLRDLPLRDACYDVVVSLSTLEHVGLDVSLYGARAAAAGGLEAAVRELRRVLRPGGTLLVTVPYGRRMELEWMRQFDAADLDVLRAAFQPSAWTARFYGYGASGWTVGTAESLAAAEYHDVWTAAGPAADGAAAARAVACLELVR